MMSQAKEIVYTIFGRTTHSPNYELQLYALRDENGNEVLISEKGITLVGPKYPRRYKRFNPNNWDWYAYLRAQNKTKVKYFKEASEKASNWVTCACGQLCSRLPREETFAGTPTARPKDSQLFTLGLQFVNEIDCRDWDRAKEVLNQIEERTIYLLGLPNYTDPNA